MSGYPHSNNESTTGEHPPGKENHDSSRQFESTDHDVSDDDTGAELEFDGPSKSQRKRDALDLQKLGKQLVELSDSELASVPLETTLEDAILAARKITSNGARKRQLHYIGKLMRSADVSPIHEAMERIRQSANSETRLLHELETWREDLLDNEAESLQSFLGRYPNTELQPLRQLLRNARQEREKNRPPKAYREIFKLIRQIVADHAE